MDRTPEVLKLIEPRLPKAKPSGKLPGGIELYLNNREYRLLLKALRNLPGVGGENG